MLEVTISSRYIANVVDGSLLRKVRSHAGQVAIGQHGEYLKAYIAEDKEAEFRAFLKNEFSHLAVAVGTWSKGTKKKEK